MTGDRYRQAAHRPSHHGAFCSSEWRCHLEREATDRPNSQRTKVMLHVRAGQDLAQLHLGPALSAAERALLSCDANIMTVLEDEFGVPVSVGRDHRIVPDKTRAIVKQRDSGCAIPWCGATKYLVVHQIFSAAGGTHDDWDGFDQTMSEERRTAVLVAPSRVYSNPT